MARLVNGRQAAVDPDAERAIGAFLRALQRRLWWQNAVAWLWRGWQVSAGLLAGAGLLHVGWRSVPPLPWLALAAAPPLLALGAGLWLRRPSLTSCAWLADRRFEGGALLVSAWDLLAESRPVPASAPLILARAGRIVPGWRQQLPARYPWSLPGPARAALIVSLGGIFLLATSNGVPESALLMPESPTPPPLAHQTDGNEPPVRPTGDRPPAPGPTPVARGAASLQTARGGEPPARSLAGRPLSGERERSSGQLPAMSPGYSLANGQNPPPEANAAEGVSLDRAASHAAPAAAGAGGDAPGSGGDSRPALPDRAPAASPALRYVDLARSGSTAPTAASPGDELEPASPALPDPAPAAAPPAERVSLPAGAGGGLAMRGYVATYFATRSVDDARTSDR